MKKLLAILLTLAMVLSLATVFTACGETDIADEEETEPSQSSEEDTNPTDPADPADPSNPNSNTSGFSLLSAAKKLQTADSYTFRLSRKMTQSGYASTRELTYQVSKTDGMISYAEKSLSDSGDGEDIFSYDGNQAFYKNTEGYVLDVEDKVIHKKISDGPFTIESLLQDENYKISYGQDSVLAKFDALNPTALTAENGSVMLRAASITAAQWVEIYEIVYGYEMPEEVLPLLSNPAAYGIISPEGYLTTFFMQITQTQDGNSVEIAETFSIGNINATTTEEPDYAKDYTPMEGSKITHIKNGVKALYRCDWSYYNDIPTYEMHFMGLGEYYYDEYTVESYTVLSQVEGISVAFVENVVNNGSILVERLVIPSGIHVDILGSYDGDNGFTSGAEETTLFFEAPKVGVDKTFYTEGEEVPDGVWDPVYVKAAYYANEWALVNGIPTPL